MFTRNRQDFWNWLDIWVRFCIMYLLLLGFERYGTMAILIALILIMFVYVFTYPKYNADQVMAAFFGVVYVAVMLSFILLTRNLPDGKFIVWLIFLCSWGCDTCAYCVGMLIGKHKMAPVLSPKKSVEGAVGGVVGAALLGVIYAAANTWSRMFEYAVICGSWCTDLHGWGSCCFCNQEKSGNQRLWETDSGTWRNS